MELKSIKVNMEAMKMLCFLPSADIGEGVKAIYLFAKDGVEPEPENANALAAFNILLVCYNESMRSHEKAVARGEKSGQARAEKASNSEA